MYTYISYWSSSFLGSTCYFSGRVYTFWYFLHIHHWKRRNVQKLFQLTGCWKILADPDTQSPKHMKPYCWWKKSQTNTWEKLPTSTGAGFLPSTVFYDERRIYDLIFLGYLCTCTKGNEMDHIPPPWLFLPRFNIFCQTRKCDAGSRKENAVAQWPIHYCRIPPNSKPPQTNFNFMARNSKYSEPNLNAIWWYYIIANKIFAFHPRYLWTTFH